MNQLANLRCVILRGAFPGERVYRVIQIDSTSFEGGAPNHYFQKPDGTRLGPDEPGPGKELKGLLSVVVVSNGGDHVRVALPDNEAVVVPKSSIESRTPERELVPV